MLISFVRFSIVLPKLLVILFFSQILLYLRMCLAQSAGVAIDWQLENLPEHAPVVAARVRTLLAHYPNQQGPVQEYVGMLQELLRVTASR